MRSVSDELLQIALRPMFDKIQYVSFKKDWQFDPFLIAASGFYKRHIAICNVCMTIPFDRRMELVLTKKNSYALFKV